MRLPGYRFILFFKRVLPVKVSTSCLSVALSKQHWRRLFLLPSWPRQRMPTRVMAMATAVVITGTVVTMAIAAIMVTTVTVATMAIKGKIKASPLKITANGKTTASPTTSTAILASHGRALPCRKLRSGRLSGAAAGYRQKCRPRQTASLRGSPKRPCQLL